MKILAFGDDYGIPLILRCLPRQVLIGIVCAEIRPKQHNVLRSIAETNGLTFLIQPRHKSLAYNTFVEYVRKLAPDMILVNSYSMLLRNELLEIPRLGGVNIHGALLPQYRGANPIQWALINHEVESGVTIHCMTNDFDTGNIVSQSRISIFFDDTWVDIQNRLAIATESLLKRELPKLLDGTYTRTPQNESQACHYHRRHPADGRIDFNQSVIYIYNLIRALVTPHPGAFYSEAGKRILLDNYLTVPQVIYIKYQAIGNLFTRSDNLFLSPFNEEKVSTLPDLTSTPWLTEVDSSFKLLYDGKHKAFLERLKHRNDIILFSIDQIIDGTSIGWCYLHGINYYHKRAAITLHFNEANHSEQEYGLEALQLLLRFAFRELLLNSLSTQIIYEQDKCKTIFEKAGFRREGIFRQSVRLNEKFEDAILLSLVKQDYE